SIRPSSGARFSPASRSSAAPAPRKEGRPFFGYYNPRTWATKEDLDMQTPQVTDVQDTRSARRSQRGRAPRPYAKHGLYRLKEAVKTLGSRTIDRRTVLGRALTQWRAELIEALGGPGAVSPQQLVIVDQATTTKLLLDSVNA